MANGNGLIRINIMFLVYLMRTPPVFPTSAVDTFFWAPVKLHVRAKVFQIDLNVNSIAIYV